MEKLTVIEEKGQRVLTTSQMAKAYGTDSKTISYNFNHNKQRYIFGKHYFLLTGSELRAFREKHDLPGNVNRLYLWTEKGALLHAKSLNTDKAWEVYDYLVDFYFRAKEGQKQGLHPDRKQTPEILPEDMKRICMNRGIVVGVYRAEQERNCCDVLDIFNRLSASGKELAWSLIFGECRHEQ